MISTVLQAIQRQDEFDLLHSHLEWYSVVLAARSAGAVRRDLPRAAGRALVARGVRGRARWHGRDQRNRRRRIHPNVPWTIVHNGLTLDGAPFERRRSDDLVFVGRVTPEKGIVEAIEIALASGRQLKIAAKVGPTPHEQDYNETSSSRP